MRDRHEEFLAKGARVAAIGMGWVEAAAHFKREFSIPFTVLVDQKKETYKALRIPRGDLLKIAGPAIWLPWLKGQVSEVRQGRTKQDPAQLGGALVISQEGKVLHRHQAKNAADVAPVGRLLDALD